MAETKRSRLRISELNPHLLCALCGGYLIDATTIVECLHSFCKTCILRYLETSNYCPICEVLIHKKRPWQNIRLDHTLQNAVYKIVPGLFKREMQRRRDFYEKNPPPGKNGFAEQVHTAPERIIFSEDEKFSVSLEFSPNGRPIHDEKSAKAVSVPVQHRDKRFLLCPANVCVGHLKKFVRLKYSLPECYQIDLFYSDEPLDDHYSLMDVAYIYSWRRESVLTLYYSFHQPPPKRRKLAAPATATSQDSLPASARVKSESNSTTTSTTASSTATSAVGATDAGSSRNCAGGEENTKSSVSLSSSTTTTTTPASTTTAPKESVDKQFEHLAVFDEETDDEDDERPLIICENTPAGDAAVSTADSGSANTDERDADNVSNKGGLDAATDSNTGGAVDASTASKSPTAATATITSMAHGETGNKPAAAASPKRTGASTNPASSTAKPTSTSPKPAGTSPKPATASPKPASPKLVISSSKTSGASSTPGASPSRPTPTSTPSSPSRSAATLSRVAGGSSHREVAGGEDNVTLPPSSPKDKVTSPRGQSGSSQKSPPLGIFERIYSVTNTCSADGGIKSIFKTTALVPAGSIHRRASDVTGISPSGSSKAERRASCSAGSPSADRLADTASTQRLTGSSYKTSGEASRFSSVASPSSTKRTNSGSAAESSINSSADMKSPQSVQVAGSKTVSGADRARSVAGSDASPASQGVKRPSSGCTSETPSSEKRQSASGSLPAGANTRPACSSSVSASASSASDRRVGGTESTASSNRSQTDGRPRLAEGQGAIGDRRASASPASGKDDKLIKTPGVATADGAALSKLPGSNSGGDSRTAAASNTGKDRRGTSTSESSASKDASSRTSAPSDTKTTDGNKLSDASKTVATANVKSSSASGSATARDSGAMPRPLTLSSTSVASDRRLTSGSSGASNNSRSPHVLTGKPTNPGNSPVKSPSSGGSGATRPATAATDSRLAAVASTVGLSGSGTGGIKRPFSASSSGSSQSHGAVSSSDTSKKVAGSAGSQTPSAVRVPSTGGSSGPEAKKQKTGSSSSGSLQSPTASPAIITPTILSSSSPATASKTAGRGAVSSGSSPDNSRVGIRLPPAAAQQGNKTTFASNVGRVGGPKGQSGANHMSNSAGRILPPGNRVDSLLFRKTNEVLAAASAKRDNPLGSTLGVPSGQKKPRSESGVDSRMSFFEKTFGGGKSSKETCVGPGAGAGRSEISFSARHILSPAFPSHSTGSMTSPSPSNSYSMAGKASGRPGGTVSAKKDGGSSGACDLSTKSTSAVAKNRSNGSSSRTSEGIKLDIPRLSTSSRDSVFASDSDTSPTPPPKYSDINRNPIKMEHSPTNVSSKSGRKDPSRPHENGSRGSTGSVGSPNSVGSGPGSPLESERSPARDARRPSDSELLVGQRWHGMHPHPHLLAIHPALYNGHFKVPPAGKYMTLNPDHVPPSTSPEPMPLDYSTNSSSSTSSANKP